MSFKLLFVVIDDGGGWIVVCGSFVFVVLINNLLFVLCGVKLVICLMIYCFVRGIVCLIVFV